MERGGAEFLAAQGVQRIIDPLDNVEAIQDVDGFGKGLLEERQVAQVAGCSPDLPTLTLGETIQEGLKSSFALTVSDVDDLTGLQVGHDREVDMATRSRHLVDANPPQVAKVRLPAPKTQLEGTIST